MSILEAAGQVIQTDDEGFLVDDRQWTPDVAEAIARQAGIARLTDLHWKAVLSCREETMRSRKLPQLSRLAALSGLAVVELASYFPGDARRQIARIAGLPDPDENSTPGLKPKEAE